MDLLKICHIRFWLSDALTVRGRVVGIRIYLFIIFRLLKVIFVLTESSRFLSKNRHNKTKYQLLFTTFDMITDINKSVAVTSVLPRSSGNIQLYLSTVLKNFKKFLKNSSLFEIFGYLDLITLGWLKFLKYFIISFSCLW